MADIAMTEAKYHAMSGRLDETALRIWAATKAHSLGCGWVSPAKARGRRTIGPIRKKGAMSADRSTARFNRSMPRKLKRIVGPPV